MTDGMTIDQLRARDLEIGGELERLFAEAGTEIPTESQDAEWKALKAERETVRARIQSYEERQAALADQVDKPGVTERGTFNVQIRKTEADIFDLSSVRGAYDNPAQARRELRDRAMHAIERQH